MVVATTGASLTARNLGSTGMDRLALGSPDDVILVEVAVADAVAVDEADPLFRAGSAAAGWSPSEEGPDWRFFRLRPMRAQA